jgi:hypothetical protein
MKLSQLWFFIILVCTLAFALPPIGFSETLTNFSGNGSAIVIAGDQVEAEKLARQAALRKAISLAIESVIQKGTKEELQYQIKKSDLLKEPYPYVVTQNIIESAVEGKLLTMSVEIQVDGEALTRFLGQQGILAERIEEQKRKEMPLIMLLVGEEINGKEHRPSFCGTMLTKTLLDEGFSLVDEGAIKKSIQHDKAVQSLLRGNQKAAAAMALQYGAGIVITGRAIATKSQLKSGPMQVHGANVTLQALHADSGEIFASAIGDGSYPHVNTITGSQKAVEEATQKAVKSLLEDFQRQLETSASTLLVSISGITYEQLAYLKKILREQSRFPDLTDIQQKSFQGQVAKLQFTITNSPQEFADHLATYDFQKFALNVLSYSPRKIDFALKLNSSSSR